MSGHERKAEDPEAAAAAIRAGHEVDSVAARLLWRSAVGFVGVLLIALVVVYTIQPLMVARQEAESPPPNPLLAEYGRVEPPAPRLQVDPARDIHDQRKAEEHILTTYGWVDRQAGVVRIPIERAMSLLAERAGATAKGQGAPAAAPGGQP
jgi:hypothetical protein